MVASAGLRLLIRVPFMVTVCACTLFGPSAEEARDAHAARLLGDLVDAVSADVEIAGERIARATPETAVDRLSVHYRMRITRAARTALGYRDPHVGLLDLWALCEQVEDYLTEGEGARLFGDQQQLAVEAAQRSLEHVSRLASAAFDEKNADAARRDVEAFAREQPMRELFVRIGLLEGDIRLRTGGSRVEGALLRTLRLDWINPLSGFGSDVSESAEAVGAAMDRFTVVAELLPRQIGWQLEMFVYDIEDSGVLQRVAEGVTRAGAGVEGVAALAEGLPGRLRAELGEALRQVDPALESVQRALVEARESAEPMARLGATWGEAAARIDGMTKGVSDALAKFDGTYRMLTDGNGNGHGNGEEPPPGPPRRPFDILDWERTARSVHAMSEQLQRTLERFQHTIRDPQLDAAVAKAEDAAADTLAAATLWVVLVLTGVLGLSVLAVWLVRRLRTRPARPAT